MKIDKIFLKSKVAKRIYIQFILCAIVPIVALALISFIQVTAELEKQGKTRLHESTQTVGILIFERLNLIEKYLKALSMKAVSDAYDGLEIISDENMEPFARRFTSITGISSDRKIIYLGNPNRLPTLSDVQKLHLLSHGALITITDQNLQEPKIWMVVASSSINGTHQYFYGEINTLHLMASDQDLVLPEETHLFLLDDHNELIFSSCARPPDFKKERFMNQTRSSISSFSMTHDNKDQIVAYWSIFLRFNWFYPSIKVVGMSSKTHILSPIIFFKKVFPFVVLSALLMALLLSSIQIRKITLPLEKLKDGTKQIAISNFESRVNISSKDEFEDLGTSFNEMTGQLKSQFDALATMAEIDRAILSSLSVKEIAETVTRRMKELLKCDAVFLYLSESNAESDSKTYLNAKGQTVLELPFIKKKELINVIQEKEVVLIEDNYPDFLQAFVSKGYTSFALFPIYLKSALVGVIILGSFVKQSNIADCIQHAKKISNQVAVALSNAFLLEELKWSNWGTLEALARTVDAKSSWTAGHSERVAEKAGRLGMLLGLDDEEVDNLHRGALLHDIGKIGIPGHILDKPGKYSETENFLMMEHPRKAARILEPIKSYAPIIPMILHHHENFNGSGYPGGLMGENISFSGRILAVVDVYDALTSNRPYREKWSQEKAIGFIKREIGKKFDPKIADAFLKMIMEDTIEKEPDTREPSRPIALSVKA